MRPKITKAVKDEVKRLLPRLREEVKQEFIHWELYHDDDSFYSDEKVLEILPYSAYEYILLSWGVEPERVTMESVIQALNSKLFGDLRSITCHALRRLASTQKQAQA
jgi:hypothetical protein